MKTNLDFEFKTSKDLEQNGVWFEIKPGISFLAKRFGGMNTTEAKKIASKYTDASYIAQAKAGTLAFEREQEVMIKTFVDACMLDWKGIEIDGQPQPFSKEVCKDLFLQLPELAQTVMENAAKYDNYRVELGNS